MTSFNQKVNQSDDTLLPLCYYGNSQPRGRSTGMKLGGKDKDVDSFVDQIRAEGGKG